MSYADLLRRPEWQKRRLEVLQAADFTCSSCDAKDAELHVHHLIYRRGAKPWEYGEHELEVLCKHCHADVTALRARLDRELLSLGIGRGDALELVLGIVTALNWAMGPLGDVPEPDTAAEAEGLGILWGLTEDEVLRLRPVDGMLRHDDLREASLRANGSLPRHVRKLLERAVSGELV